MAAGQPRKISLSSAPGALIAHFVSASPISKVRAVKKAGKASSGVGPVNGRAASCQRIGSQSVGHSPLVWQRLSHQKLLFSLALRPLPLLMLATNCAVCPPKKHWPVGHVSEQTSVSRSSLCVCCSRVASQKVRSFGEQSFLRPSPHGQGQAADDDGRVKSENPKTDKITTKGGLSRQRANSATRPSWKAQYSLECLVWRANH